jgi:hypothetical protein
LEGDHLTFTVVQKPGRVNYRSNSSRAILALRSKSGAGAAMVTTSARLILPRGFLLVLVAHDKGIDTVVAEFPDSLTAQARNS